MKHLIFTIIVFINTGNLIAQNSRVDTIVNAIWNGAAWQNRFRTINNYDADCRLTTALTQSWDAATVKWLDYSMGTYSYVNGNYISEILTQFWFNNSWTNNYRQTYTYDAFFKTQFIVGQTWSADHWSNYTSTSNKYDNYGYADSVLVQSSYGDAPFENTYLYLYINNSDGTPVQTVNQNWNRETSSWDNYLKNSFVYNSRKTLDTTTTALWNYGTALWQFNTRTIYTYTGAGKLFYYTGQVWEAGQWYNQWEYTSSYDNNGFVSNVLGKRWDGFDFENYNQNTYKNNSDGTIYQHVAQYWSNAANNWVNSTRETYSYSASCVLPLQLLAFTATKNNHTVNLNWQAADEVNSSHFTVQRSLNGVDFINLGDVQTKAGAGNSSYAYPDNIEKITTDKIWYRLKIIDKDGSYTYSKTVPVTISSYAGTLKVYPNPAKDQVFVLFKMQNTGKAALRITDISGKIVYSNIVHENQDTGIAGVNISALNKGMYYVLIITGNDTQRTQFLKQ